MKQSFEKYLEIKEKAGTGNAVALVFLLGLLGIGLIFLSAWIYQMVWNYGIVWLVAQLGGSVPTIGYWVGMGLWLVVKFIRRILTPNVKVEE